MTNDEWRMILREKILWLTNRVIFKKELLSLVFESFA